MSAAIEVRGVSHRYGAQAALAEVSLEIPRGHFAVLLGPSGSGKTTLLSILGGFLTPSEGRVLIDGVDMTEVPPAKRPTTTVFQDYALFPHMSVAANVGFGLRMRGVGGAERRAQVERALEMVGLGGSARRKPHQLSGGQRQRVALARALAVEPAVLLLDEPLGALDLKLRRQMQAELKEIQRRVGTTFVHVTHDQDEAIAVADHIIVLNAGRIEDRGDPERIYLRPRTLFAAGFMGETNFIAGTVGATGAEGLMVATALGALGLRPAENIETAPGQAVTLSIRPEHFLVGAAGAGKIALGRARIADAAFSGAHYRCRVVAEGGLELIIDLALSARPAAGDEIALAADPAHVVLLPAQPSR